MNTLFGKLRSYFSINLKVIPITAITIKSGEDIPDPTAPDNAFVRIKTAFGSTIYIPGSSLKGVFRSHSESILTAFNKEVCGFIYGRHKNGDCGRKKLRDSHGNEKSLGNFEDIKHRYSKSCYSCRMYGSTALSSIVRFDDFYPFKSTDSLEEKKEKVAEILKYLSTRHGIKIDRKSGSVSNNALYDVEVLAGGELFGGVQLRNPEIWQLGLLFKTIEDINDGYKKIGGMKSRGLGKVRIEIETIKILSATKDLSFMEFNNGFRDRTFKFNSLNTVSKNVFTPYRYEISSELVEDFKNEVYKHLEGLRW